MVARFPHDDGTTLLARVAKRGFPGTVGGRLRSATANYFDTRARASAVSLSAGDAGALAPPGVQGDQIAPEAPTNLILTTDLSPDQPGWGIVSASWTAPTLNADGSTLTDLREYQVQWRGQGAGTWTNVPSYDTDADLPPLPEGTTVEVQVRALDIRGNASDPTAVESITVAKDTTPPAAPSAPMASSRLGTVTVVWDGKTFAGDPMVSVSPDVELVQVHASASTGFTPDDTTRRGDIIGREAGFTILADEDLGGTLYLRLVAVDYAGNPSASSAETTVVVKRVEGPDLEANSVTTNHLDVGAVVAEKIDTLALDGWLFTGATMRSAASGQRWVGDIDGIRLYDASDDLVINLPVVGTATFKGSIASGSTIAANTEITSPIITGGTIQGSVFRTAASGQRIEIASIGTNQIAFYPTDGTNPVSISAINDSQLGSGWGAIKIEASQTGSSVYVGNGVTELNQGLSLPFTSTIRLDDGDIDITSGVRIDVISSAIAMAFGTLTLKDTSGSYNDFDIGVRPDGHWLFRAWGTSGMGALKFLTSSALIQARDSGDGAYANFRAADVMYKTLTAEPSSARFKRDITPVAASTAERFLGLQAKTFVFDHPELPGDEPHTGYIMEEVLAAGLTDYVSYDENGDPVGLKIVEMLTMLHPIVKDLSSRVASLETRRTP